MKNKREWKIEYNVPQPPLELLQAGCSPLLASVLSLRGINTGKEAREFLKPDDLLYDPYLIKDMDRGVDRIMLARERREKVIVYGDYDVDGITSTCLLTDYLRSIGISAQPHIPDRSGEGYGLNGIAIDRISAEGVSLIITVDCGITAVEDTLYSKSLGVDLLITDHHECRADGLPEATAVIDIKRPDDESLNKDLAGVGVAFKVACACCRRLGGTDEEILSRYGDLVAIGTVADVMALKGENRFLVIAGLRQLNSSPRPGLAAMLNEIGIKPGAITASVVGFNLAPRLNAAGRLGRAITAAEMIMSTDETEARTLAHKLCDLNRERQSIEQEIYNEALSTVGDSGQDVPIVLASAEWHQGVIGIAASRIAERFNVPTIMICLSPDGNFGKGSCRSVGGFNLYDALTACSDDLISFGGHALAAGLNIRADMIDTFRASLAEYYRSNRPAPQPEVCCDLLITDPAMLSVDNVRSLDALEPFGAANPRPVMCMLGVKIISAIQVGGGRHLKMRVSKNGTIFDAIFFSHSLSDLELSEGDYADIAFSPQINEFRGHISVQLGVSALRPHSGEELCSDIIDNSASYIRALSQFCPERRDFVAIWRALPRSYTLADSLGDILSLCPAGMLPETFCLCLEAFMQAGLLSGGVRGLYGAGPSVTPGEKADLEATELMLRLRKASHE